MAVQKIKYPVGIWANLCTEIPYDDGSPSSLKSRHPVSKGIYVPSTKTGVRSIQMVIPNIFAYDDSFFQDKNFYYYPSIKDKNGNAALEEAYLDRKAFLAYIGYKSNTRDVNNSAKLTELGIPKRYHGKSYRLGWVRIKSKQDGYYVMEPVS